MRFAANVIAINEQILPLINEPLTNVHVRSNATHSVGLGSFHFAPSPQSLHRRKKSTFRNLVQTRSAACGSLDRTAPYLSVGSVRSEIPEWTRSVLVSGKQWRWKPQVVSDGCG